MTNADTNSLPGRYLLLLGGAALVILIDQVSKAVVRSTLENQPAIVLLGGLVRLDYARNTGAAFSMLPSGGLLFEAVAAIVCVGILVLFPRLGPGNLVALLALSLILGGAAGNLLDRLRMGYVVDFIDFRWWPVFNLADSAIVLGACLLALRALLSQDAR